MANDMSLEDRLLGVYGYGDCFRVYPQPGVNMDEVLNHEFTHVSLAISTTSGLVHQLLAYLGFQSSSPLREHWRALYKESITLARNAHESTATFVGLCEAVGELGTDRVFSEYQVPANYREWFMLFHNIIPRELRVSVRRCLALAVAGYAFDVPLDSLRSATWRDLIDINTCSRMLPRVDERFLTLLNLLGNPDGQTFLRAMASERSLPDVSRKNGETLRQFLARRRLFFTQQRSSMIADLLARFGGILPGIQWDQQQYLAHAIESLNELRRTFSENGDEGLASFDRRLDTPDGEDPLLYQCEIYLPSRPLSGLIRVIDDSQLRHDGLSLIHVVRPSVDCFLSSDLILRSDQFYTRYYFLEGGGRARTVPYSITDTFPVKVWSFPSAVTVLQIAGGGGLDELLQAAGRSDNEQPTLVWLLRLTRERFDSVLAERDHWRFGYIKWVDCPQVITIVLYNVPRNAGWLTNAAGADAEIFVEESADMLKPLSDLTGLRRAVDMLGQLFPLICPAEGVPVDYRCRNPI